jgi:hypothetical protein
MAECFSCSLDAFQKGQGINNLHFFYIKKVLYSLKILQCFVINTLNPDAERDPHRTKMQDPETLKPMRIHNTGKKQ